MIDIPISNPVRFRPLTGQTEPNFDNTFEDDYTGENRTNKPFAQYVSADGWYLQVVTDYNTLDESGNCSVDIVENYEGTVNGFGPPVIIEMGGFYYHTFEIRPMNTGCFKLWCVDGTDYLFESEWLHNPVGGIATLRASNTNLYLVEWYNIENNYGIEYVESGLVNRAYIEAKLIWGQPAGDSVIFDNQGEEVKLKETVQRVFMLSLDAPAYICEMLTVAMSHDMFFINDMQYINSKKPQVSQIGNSNIYSFNSELKQVAVIGLNTHDTGFDCDASKLLNMILNSTFTGVSTSFTDTAPSGYVLHLLTVLWVSGDGTLSLGTTAGGTDIFSAENVDSVDNLQTIEVNLPIESTQILYATITGTVSMTVNFQYLKNR